MKALALARLLVFCHQAFASRHSDPSIHPRSAATVHEALLGHLSPLEEVIKASLGSGRNPIVFCDPDLKYRTADGRCNNFAHPKYGSAVSLFRRLLSPVYDDRLDSPRTRGSDGAPLPGARLVSTAMHSARPAQPSDPRHSHLLMQWGQFLDHDITFTPVAKEKDGPSGPYGRGGPRKEDCGDCPGEGPQVSLRSTACFPIRIPADDAVMPPGSCMRFVRSEGSVAQGRREQLNRLTAFVDASNVYGSHEGEARGLRSFSGGQLKLSHHGGLPLDQEAECKASAVSQGHLCFKAGDERCNVQPGLAAVHGVWVRQHNRLAAALKALNPAWDDEKLYQEARRIVGAQHQRITYAEWLPKILGPALMKQFDLDISKPSKYNDKCDPGILNSFATAAFRFGHTLIGSTLRWPNNATMPLARHFVDPSPFSPDPMHNSSQLLVGMSGQSGDAFDGFVVPAMRDHLFADDETKPGLDIVALNLQRGRDHGLPPYAAFRAHYGLAPVDTWERLAAVVGQEAAEKFKKLYASPKDIDLFSGMISEPSVSGGVVGELCGHILGEQLRSLKDCDRFFHSHVDQAGSFSEAQLAFLKRSSLGGVICEVSGGQVAGSEVDAFSATGGGLACGSGGASLAGRLGAWQEPLRG